MITIPDSVSTLELSKLLLYKALQSLNPIVELDELVELDEQPQEDE